MNMHGLSMTAERMTQIQAISDEALRIHPRERPGFLTRACASDNELRAQVQTMIVSRIETAVLEDIDAAGERDSHLLGPLDMLKERYLLRHELGRGGFGIVYLASDEQLRSKLVVVKILLQTEIDAWERRRFKKEVEALARLNHPGIVSVLDSGEAADGRPFLVLEYVPGVILRSMLHSDGMQLDIAAGILRQIAGALEAAHEQGIWHRDLKPENIMVQTLLDGERRAKLIDFGLAINSSSRLSDVSTRMAGTLRYMAPEQLRGKPSAASDIYALGVVAYEMVTGRTPFNATGPFELHEMQMAGRYINPRSLRQELSKRSEQAITRALSFVETERYAKALALAAEFASAIRSPELVVGNVSEISERADSGLENVVDNHGAASLDALMIERATFQILGAQGSIVGTATAVFPRGLAVTCAHVVARAIGVSPYGSRPTGRVRVRFPAVAMSAEASVVAWSPLAESDVAVLEISESSWPRDVHSVPMFQLLSSRGRQFRTFGFPFQHSDGQWGHGRLLDNLPGRLLQISTDDMEPGFSGGPVQDLQMGRVFGIASVGAQEQGVVFAIPAATLKRICDRLILFKAEMKFSPLTNGLTHIAGDPLTRLEQFLEEYLGTPDQPRPFGGRQSQFQALSKWSGESAFSTALIAAPAGRGKSALLARWSALMAVNTRADVVFVPISIRFNTAMKSRFAALLGARLRHVCMPGRTENSVDLDADKWLAEIGQRLRENRTPGQPPVIIVIDGLDEASDWRAGEEISLPNDLGSGMKLLVSARLLGQDNGPENWLRRLGWSRSTTEIIALPPLDFEAIGEVLRSMGNPLAHLATRVDVIGELFRLSEGDPLLISLYVEALRGKGGRVAFLKPEELERLPPGLQGYFEGWWTDQLRSWGPRAPLRETVVQTVLNLLGTSLGPLNATDLIELGRPESLNTWVLENAVQPLARFVVGNGREQGYVFSHPRLADYFLERIQGELQEWDRRFVLYGRETLRKLNEAKMSAHDASPYIIQNYRAHLERSRAPEQEYYALVSEGWIRAWEAIDGSHTGFWQDLETAWKAAERAQDNGWQIRCAVCQSSLVAVHAFAPPMLILRGLEFKLLTEPQALGLARQTTEEGRSHLLALICTNLDESHRYEALIMARAMEDEGCRARVLGALGSCAREGLVELVLEDAATLRIGEFRASVLIAVTHQLHSISRLDLLDEVFRLAADITDEALRTSVIGVACECLPPDLFEEALRQAFRLKVPERRAELLAALAPRLSPDLMGKALDSARGIWFDFRRAKALIALLPYLAPAQQTPVAWETLSSARKVREENLRVTAIAEVVPWLPPLARDAAIRYAISIAARYTAGNRRAKLLRMLIPLLSLSTETVFVSAIQGIEDSNNRGNLLAAFAISRASEENFARALECLRKCDNFDRSRSIEELAPHLSGAMLAQAAALAKSISHFAPRIHALVAIAARMKTREKNELLDLAIDAVRAAGEHSLEEATSCLVSIAPALSQDRAEKAIELTRKLYFTNSLYGGRSDHYVCHVRALAVLAPRVDEGRRREVLTEALESAARVPLGPLRAGALEPLVPLLDQDLVRLALARAGSIGDGEIRGKFLNNLSNASLPELASLDDVLPALQTIKVTGNKRVKVWLLKHVPKIGNEHVLSALKDEWLELLNEAIKSKNEALMSSIAPDIPAEAVNQAIIAVQSWLPSEKALAFARLAMRMGPPYRQELLNEALRAAPSVFGKDDGYKEFSLLAGLAVDDMLEAVLETVRALNNSEDAAYALLSGARGVKQDTAAQIADWALGIASKMEFGFRRARMIGGIAAMEIPADRAEQALLLLSPGQDEKVQSDWRFQEEQDIAEGRLLLRLGGRRQRQFLDSVPTQLANGRKYVSICRALGQFAEYVPRNETCAIAQAAIESGRYAYDAWDLKVILEGLGRFFDQSTQEKIIDRLQKLRELRLFDEMTSAALEALAPYVSPNVALRALPLTEVRSASRLMLAQRVSLCFFLEELLNNGPPDLAIDAKFATDHYDAEDRILARRVLPKLLRKWADLPRADFLSSLDKILKPLLAMCSFKTVLALIEGVETTANWWP